MRGVKSASFDNTLVSTVNTGSPSNSNSWTPASVAPITIPQSVVSEQQFYADKAAQDAANADAYRTLFLGDLSYFCTEDDLCKVFASYGQITTVRVRRGMTGESLMHGFIALESHESAKKAIKDLDGYIFMGRSMRVQLSSEGPRPQAPKEGLVQIHVSFISKQLTTIVTEVVLREIFSPFGAIADVAVRRHTVVQKQNRQSGYGFVYFLDIAAANNAMATLKQHTVRDITLDCSISHKSEHTGKKTSPNNGSIQSTHPNGMSYQVSGWDTQNSEHWMSAGNGAQQFGGNMYQMNRTGNVADYSSAPIAVVYGNNIYYRYTAVPPVAPAVTDPKLQLQKPYYENGAGLPIATTIQYNGMPMTNGISPVTPVDFMSNRSSYSGTTAQLEMDIASMSLQSFSSDTQATTEASKVLPLWTPSAPTPVSSTPSTTNGVEIKSSLTATAREFVPSTAMPLTRIQSYPNESTATQPVNTTAPFMSYSYPSTGSRLPGFESRLPAANASVASNVTQGFPLDFGLTTKTDDFTATPLTFANTETKQNSMFSSFISTSDSLITSNDPLKSVFTTSLSTADNLDTANTSFPFNFTNSLNLTFNNVNNGLGIDTLGAAEYISSTKTTPQLLPLSEVSTSLTSPLMSSLPLPLEVTSMSLDNHNNTSSLSSLNSPLITSNSILGWQPV